MSGSRMADGLVIMLSAASLFGTEAVSKNDYAVLESSAGSAVVIQPRGFSTEWRTFGGGKKRVWRLMIEGYVRDTGDPQSVLDRLWQIADDINDCIDADDTLQGTAETAITSRGDRSRDSFVEAGGAVWLPYDFIVEAEEWL